MDNVVAGSATENRNPPLSKDPCIQKGGNAEVRVLPGNRRDLARRCLRFRFHLWICETRRAEKRGLIGNFRFTQVPLTRRHPALRTNASVMGFVLRVTEITICNWATNRYESETRHLPRFIRFLGYTPYRFPVGRQYRVGYYSSSSAIQIVSKPSLGCVADR